MAAPTMKDKNMTHPELRVFLPVSASDRPSTETMGNTAIRKSYRRRGRGGFKDGG